jgi:hypothetical protein
MALVSLRGQLPKTLQEMEQPMIKNEVETLTDEMQLYEMAYLRGRDAHQKRVLRFISEHFALCSANHRLTVNPSDDCHICNGAKAWHDAIKSELDRRD